MSFAGLLKPGRRQCEQQTVPDRHKAALVCSWAGPCGHGEGTMKWQCLAITAPIHVQPWNNSLPATSVCRLLLFKSRWSVQLQRGGRKCYHSPYQRASALAGLTATAAAAGERPRAPSLCLALELWAPLALPANDKKRGPAANAHHGNASVHSSGKAHRSTFEALSCLLTSKPTSFWFSKDTSLVKHCSPKQFRVQLDEN